MKLKEPENKNYAATIVEIKTLNPLENSDNRPENLELWSTSQPAGQRVSDKLKWAKEIIKAYGK